MAKAPAFQFYVRDWLAAPEVRRVSPMSRGIWIDVLCFMWEEREQGKLTCSVLELARMTGATLEEAIQFIREAERHALCNLKISGDVTNGHAEVTLVNRRMHGEWKEKESARLRKQKQRQSHANHADGHSEVTSYSSSASATAKTEEEPSLRSGSCPEVAEPPAGQQPAELPKLVGTLPIAGKDAYGKPKFFEVRQDLVDELSPLFPAVDVVQALRSMKAWLLADPKRLKTAKGVRRFITGWLDRDQNKGGNMPAARASPGQAQPRTYQDHQREERRGTAIELMHAMGMTGGQGHGSVDESGSVAGDAVFQPALGELGAEVAGGVGRS